MEDLKESPRITKEFILNEVKEYTELTGLTEFSIEGRDELLKLTVKDGIIRITYESEVLYQGTIDGTEGAMTEKYFSDRMLDLANTQHPELLVHSGIRRLAGNVGNRASSIWKERIILVCDHKEGTTRLNRKLLGIGFKTNDCVLSAFGDYPLRCVIQVDGEEYTLDQNWGESFIIYRHLNKGQRPAQHEPVDTLILPQDHSVLQLLREIEDEE